MVGAVLLAIALCFAGAVSVYAIQQDGQEEAAGSSSSPGIDLPESAEPLNGTPPTWCRRKSRW